MMQHRDDEQTSSTGAGLRLPPELKRIGLVVLVFGLLLWARFLLVTGHPRTAVADPPADQPHAAPVAAAQIQAPQAHVTDNSQP
jgi:hypothetical protein